MQGLYAVADRSSRVTFKPLSSNAEPGPPPARVWHRTIWKGRSGDPHGRVPDPGLPAITVQEVLDELGKLPPPAPQVIRRFFR
ncbi:MAG: hypothetical protein QOE87_424 [Gaiellales bacterium]|nr:hypothetical protein [Gaiellales bacterium]